MKDLIKKILKEEVSDEYILEIPNLRFIPNADLKSSKGKTNAWNELLSLLKGKPFIFDDDLDLMYSNITSLGNLRSVNGDLKLYRCMELTSLGNLQSVGGDLDLARCKRLTSLGNLQSVDGYLSFYECEELTSLGNLQSVNGNLNLNGCIQLTSLGDLESVGGYLDLYGCEELTSLGNLQSVNGFLDLIKTRISKTYTKEEIGQMVDVKGEIYLE